jgi:secondary thiamine-phosphate synthase enzyme
MSEKWIQKKIRLPPKPRGFHLITRQIEEAVPELKRCEAGLLHLFLQHTSASLTLNENADPDVRRDLESVLSATAPERFSYRHTAEGPDDMPDDMPAHYKASLLGVSLCIPVSDGALLLGTWQGIYLGEHRVEASPRCLVLTLHGQFRE